MADLFKTPLKNKLPTGSITIPASPFMTKLGYGTGVSVYKFQRSPLFDKTRSPWAVKRTIKTKSNSTEITRRLLDEASILGRLNHPNVIGFRALTKDVDGKDCLVMEQCSSSVGDLIEDRREATLDPFPAPRILKAALDVAKAMNYLHNEALILHCDIKSYNILVKGDFEICKLCDFGVALPLNVDGYVEEDDFNGTLCWTAPEVLNCQLVSTKADIYSYGLVLWEMLALQPPPEPNLDDSMTCEVTRPELPSTDLTDDYNYVLELFYCCTEGNPMARPTACDLVDVVGEMLK